MVLFCVPEAMESLVLYRYHDEMGHVGIDKMMDLISGSYWFLHMKGKATKNFRNCLRCISNSDNHEKEEVFPSLRFRLTSYTLIIMDLLTIGDFRNTYWLLSMGVRSL